MRSADYSNLLKFLQNWLDLSILARLDSNGQPEDIDSRSKRRFRKTNEAGSFDSKRTSLVALWFLLTLASCFAEAFVLRRDSDQLLNDDFWLVSDLDRGFKFCGVEAQNSKI